MIAPSDKSRSMKSRRFCFDIIDHHQVMKSGFKLPALYVFKLTNVLHKSFYGQAQTPPNPLARMISVDEICAKQRMTSTEKQKKGHALTATYPVRHFTNQPKSNRTEQQGPNDWKG